MESFDPFSREKSKMATVKPRPIWFLRDEQREKMQKDPLHFYVVNERVLAMDTEIARLRGALQQVTDELGVPSADYPAPVANAWNVAKCALNLGIEQI